MQSFCIEERVTDKNCSVTGLKRGVEFRKAVESEPHQSTLAIVFQTWSESDGHACSAPRAFVLAMQFLMKKESMEPGDIHDSMRTLLWFRKALRLHDNR